MVARTATTIQREGRIRACIWYTFQDCDSGPRSVAKKRLGSKQECESPAMLDEHTQTFDLQVAAADVFRLLI
jgi:hypothetical protein